MAKAMLAAVFGAVLSTSVFAHHPFTDEFDRNQPVTLSGTVTKLEWQNPHVYAHIDVKNEQGQVANWKIEMGSPGELTLAGWNQSRIKIGDQVTIKGWRAKDNTNLANADSFTLPDGKNMAAASSFYSAGEPVARKDAGVGQPAGTSGQEANQLPRTGSPIALLGIIAALSIAAAAGLRATR